jgi:hypothetical protein
MKLGKHTASVNNWISSNAVIGQPTPEVGMGATILGWTDRHPATIVEVSKDRGAVLLKVQEDDYRRLDKNGMSECQQYLYSPNPNGRVHHYRQDKSGRWVEVEFNEETKRWNKRGGGLRIGEREKYHDFSF